MWIYCEECGKAIGKVVFSWFDPPEHIVYDNGMKLFPEVSICEQCLEGIDTKLADYVRKGKVIE